MPDAAPFRPTARQREDLADAGLLLKTAAHDCGAAGHGGADGHEALRAALMQAEQAVTTLRRILDGA
jgi:hypothetical protein